MDTISKVYITAEVIVGVLSVVGNSVVLAAIIRTRQLHSVTNVFVANLALADIVVGLLVAPLAALSFEGLPEHFYGCVIINSLILLFTNVSILMLLSIALERFLAIKEPYVYQRLMTVRRAIYINIAVWLLGSMLGFVPVVWNSGHRHLDRCEFTGVITYEYMVYFQFFGLVLLPLFLMLCIYIYILIIVRRHMRQTNALHRQLQQNRTANETGRDAKERRAFNKDVRAAKTFALVILIFAICWLPVNLFNCVSLFCSVNCPFPIESLLVAIVMSHANSSINPFLYAVSNTRINRAMKRLFNPRVNLEDSVSEANRVPRSNVANDSIAALAQQSAHQIVASNNESNSSPVRHGPVYIGDESLPADGSGSVYDVANFEHSRGIENGALSVDENIAPSTDASVSKEKEQHDYASLQLHQTPNTSPSSDLSNEDIATRTQIHKSNLERDADSRSNSSEENDAVFHQIAVEQSPGQSQPVSDISGVFYTKTSTFSVSAPPLHNGKYLPALTVAKHETARTPRLGVLSPTRSLRSSRALPGIRQSMDFRKLYSRKSIHGDRELLYTNDSGLTNCAYNANDEDEVTRRNTDTQILKIPSASLDSVRETSEAEGDGIVANGYLTHHTSSDRPSSPNNKSLSLTDQQDTNNGYLNNIGSTGSLDNLSSDDRFIWVKTVNFLESHAGLDHHSPSIELEAKEKSRSSKGEEQTEI